MNIDQGLLRAVYPTHRTGTPWKKTSGAAVHVFYSNLQTSRHHVNITIRYDTWQQNQPSAWVCSSMQVCPCSPYSESKHHNAAQQDIVSHQYNAPHCRTRRTWVSSSYPLYVQLRPLSPSPPVPPPRPCCMWKHQLSDP